MDKLKIDLGGGLNPKEGFINLDRLDSPKVDIKIDLGAILPLENNSVSEIYSSHFLEHLNHRIFPFVIFEMVRISAHGAKWTIITPHPHRASAMTSGHFHVISKEWWKQIEINKDGAWLFPEGKIVIDSFEEPIKSKMKEYLNQHNIEKSFALNHLCNIAEELIMYAHIEKL